MVELFSSEDNSSSEEELVKQVNTVESSKGGGMRRLARIVMGVLLDMDAKANERGHGTANPLLLGTRGVSVLPLHRRLPLARWWTLVNNYSKSGH